MDFLGVLALMYLLALIASDYKLENIPQVQILLYWEGEGEGVLLKSWIIR